MKRVVSLLSVVAVAAAIYAPSLMAQGLVDLEVLVAASVTEAGPPPDNWKVYQIIKDKLKINLKLTFAPATPQDQDTKINTAAAANRLPDLFFANRDAWLRAVQKGLVGEVGDILKQMPTRAKKYYDDPEEQELITYKGKRYGFADPGAAVKPLVEGLVIRKDWLDRLKLKMPTTTEELFEVARAFTEKDPDGNGKNDTRGYGAFIEQNSLLDGGIGRRFYPVMGAYGVPIIWDTSAKSFGLAVRKPEFFDAIAFIKKMQDARVLDPDWATLKKEEFRTRWKEGKFGIMFEQFAALATQSNYGPFDKNFPNGEWVPVPAIKGPAGKAANAVAIKAVRIYAVSAKAARDTAKAAAIARLYEWMSTPEGYYWLGFGEKDVNFKIGADGVVNFDGIDKTKRSDAKEMQPFTQLRNLVYTNDDKELYPRYPTYKSANGKTMNPLTFLSFFNKQAYYNGTAASFINPPTNAADFQRFYDENLIKFVMGQTALNKDNWTKFIAGLDSLKAKEWEAAAKAQLAEIDQLH